MPKPQWSTNLTVRTQISAFLASTFFAVLLVLVTRQNPQTILDILTIVSLTVTFVPFAFSTFAYGLSADLFRKGAEQEEKTVYWEQRAKDVLYVGGAFFKWGYFSMMFSLTFVLAYAHWLIAIFGFIAFAGSWAYLYIKTGPYKEKKREKQG